MKPYVILTDEFFQRKHTLYVIPNHSIDVYLSVLCKWFRSSLQLSIILLLFVCCMFHITRAQLLTFSPNLNERDIGLRSFQYFLKDKGKYKDQERKRVTNLLDTENSSRGSRYAFSLWKNQEDWSKTSYMYIYIIFFIP